MTLPVVAVLKAKAGKEKELEQLLHTLVTGTHREPGCVTYALHRAQNEAGTFVFVEKWEEMDDLTAHVATPHIAELLRRKNELISQMDVYPLDAIGLGLPEKSRF
jgi:quinol monooxygenase YgiN